MNARVGVGCLGLHGRRQRLWHPCPVTQVRRDTVTPEKVLDAALAIVESEGVDALSMRRLADELGVKTPSLYWHIGGRQEILDRLIERITMEIAQIRPRGSTPEARVISVCLAILKEVRRRPYIVAISRTAGRGEAIFVRAQELLARELQAAGLHGAEAAFALRTILYQVGGFLLVDHGVEHEATIRGADRWNVDDPALLAAARKAVDVDQIFRYSLEAILARLLPAKNP
jgi:TetR/AcrR family transcriptional regulator, tetracycline repressor protein